VHQRCDGVTVHRSSGAQRPSCQRLGIGRGGHEGNLAIRLEAPQSGVFGRHASAHLVGHRAKDLQMLNAACDQRGEPAQGGLFRGEPTILGVQGAVVEVLVEFSSTFLGGYESIHRTIVDRQVRWKPCARFALIRACCLRVGVDSATC
jgi:hypothetical protein